jgi:hypothetical protein
MAGSCSPRRGSDVRSFDPSRHSFLLDTPQRQGAPGALELPLRVWPSSVLPSDSHFDPHSEMIALDAHDALGRVTALAAFYDPLGARYADMPALLDGDELDITPVEFDYDLAFYDPLGARYADMPTLLAGDELPPLIDVTPFEFVYDLSWPRWLADADAWLGDPGHLISAPVWLGHISTLLCGSPRGASTSRYR